MKIGLIGDTLFAGRGLSDIHPAWFPAAGFSYRKKPGRTEFVVAGRVSLGTPVLEMLGRGSSANLGAMALAEGIALLPPDASVIEEGMLLRFEPFCHC